MDVRSVQRFSCGGKKGLRSLLQAGFVTAVEAQYGGPFAVALEDFFDAAAEHSGNFARREVMVFGEVASAGGAGMRQQIAAQCG